MMLLSVCLFTAAACAVLVATVCLALFALTRAVLRLFTREVNEHVLPDDWWEVFERDFRWYADAEYAHAREAERHRH